jgi:DNA-binding GntR family transcriptional regulator
MTSSASRAAATNAIGGWSASVNSGRRLAPLAYDMLKERLLDGVYQAGERLSVEALKAEFGVSKQPVMDALRRLSTDGLVEIIPQVGVRVPVYTTTDVSDFFALFGGLEGAVAGVAAGRRTEQQLEELKAVNDAIGNAASTPDPGARSHQYRMLNRRFHGVIHEMAHSAVIAGLSRRMWDMSDLLINTSGVSQPLASSVPERHDDHEKIIDALRNRDVPAARDAMEAHIVSTVGIIRSEHSQHSP